MPLLVLRLLTRFGSWHSWGTPITVALLVFVTSWPLMVLAEPAGSELVRLENYWWYFVVTTTTVGYGDMYPVTAAGHVVGGYVIVGGIATITTVFTKMVSVLERSRRRRMQGEIRVVKSGHIVLHARPHRADHQPAYPGWASGRAVRGRGGDQSSVAGLGRRFRSR